jgi:hypothetical protein
MQVIPSEHCERLRREAVLANVRMFAAQLDAVAGRGSRLRAQYLLDVCQHFLYLHTLNENRDYECFDLYRDPSIMEFVPSPPIMRVLCADCGKLHFSNTAPFAERSSRHTHRAQFRQSVRRMLAKYVSPLVCSTHRPHCLLNSSVSTSRKASQSKVRSKEIISIPNI